MIEFLIYALITIAFLIGVAVVLRIYDLELEKEKDLNEFKND